MKFNKLPPADYLRECLRYNRRTGKLFWKRRPKKHFSTVGMWNTWNKRFSSTEAFCAVRQTPQGIWHASGTLDWKHYATHRVIWKLVTGQEPPAIVDHKDRDGLNNKWNNLRSATKGQNNINAQNLERGIWWDKFRNRWAASVHFNQKQIHLGRFTTKEAALIARRKKAVELFGEFVP